MRPIVAAVLLLLAALAGPTGASGGPGAALRSLGGPDAPRRTGAPGDRPDQGGDRPPDRPGRTASPGPVFERRARTAVPVSRCRLTWQRRPGHRFRCAVTPHRGR